MSYRVEITKRAERAVREIVLWIADYSPEKAADWYFDFLAAAESLAIFPARCAIIPESEENPIFRHLIFGKYRIIFGSKMKPFTLFTSDIKNRNPRRS